MSCRGSNDTNRKVQYKRYCKILIDVLKTAKEKYYDELISKSKNKAKTTWKIIKKIGNNSENDIKSLKTNDTKTNNPHEIANTFNDYFLTVMHTIIRSIKKVNTKPKDNVEP